ncbi:hypothetical protein SS50377_25075 [Spironucleus salmonicida]|uniref:c-Myc-binding protein n=1 Tax=Spironucleus salmonicida TaxID=348837 RepID=V6LQA7_9EUKA|nr:hypothetical protein SS50377_25075 [Spironucleus salmonicida]|eukprot:EST42944.1 hypothetical protein SS50377_17391 [Spironucleus salmonicida]
MSDTDLKRAEFRRYLQRTGVADSITKAFVALYEESEKPANALEFVASFLGCSGEDKIAALTAQIEEIQKENEELKRQLESRNRDE